MARNQERQLRSKSVFCVEQGMPKEFITDDDKWLKDTISVNRKLDEFIQEG